MQLVASWQTNVVFLGHLRSVYPAVLNFTTYSTTRIRAAHVTSRHTILSSYHGLAFIMYFWNICLGSPTS